MSLPALSADTQVAGRCVVKTTDLLPLHSLKN